MIIKAIIVDDEIASRDILKGYLVKYCPNIKLAGEASNIKDALSLTRNTDFDLLFLDVEMPFGSGFDLLERSGKIDFHTIFVTAYNQYAKDALNAHASYYIVKPIAIEELIKAVDYIISIKEKENALNQKVVSYNNASVSGKLTLPQQDGFELINTEDVLFCKADDNYSEIYLKNGKRKVISKTLKYVENALPKEQFARVHKSYLVNLNEIVRYHKGKGGSVELSNGKQIMVSASKKAELLAHFK